MCPAIGGGYHRAASRPSLSRVHLITGDALAARGDFHSAAREYGRLVELESGSRAAAAGAAWSESGAMRPLTSRRVSVCKKNPDANRRAFATGSRPKRPRDRARPEPRRIVSLSPRRRALPRVEDIALPNPFRHIDIRPPAPVRVRHHPRHHIAQLSVEQKRVTAPQVPKVGEVARQVAIQIRSRQRSHPRVVIGPQRHGQRATPRRLNLERRHQPAADAAPAMFLPHDQRVQFPNPATILGQSADPADNISLSVPLWQNPPSQRGPPLRELRTDSATHQVRRNARRAEQQQCRECRQLVPRDQRSP
jgi:hypothetical protein